MSHIHYDEKHDILYCDLSNDSDRYGVPDGNGVTVFRRIDCDKVCGFMIDGISKMLSKQEM